MKKLLLISLALVLCASTAFGQAGAIGLFVDNPGFANCNLYAMTPGLYPVYVVHKLCPGATASQFMVVPGGGWDCTFTGEVIAIPVSIGSSLGGLSASYGGCRASDILISTINWFCMGTTPTCAFLEVVPDPAAPSGAIEVVNCSFVKLYGQGGALYANSDGSCHCWDPVESTSWGGVKALYR